MATLTEHEAQHIEAANATGRPPIVFVHGLWLLPSSWDRWAVVFEEAGPKRGPLLIVSGEKDHTVPWAIANASFKRQKRNEGVTEIVEMKDRGHALTIDSGWREVADTALEFVKRFV